jgi:hypothetical protein
LNLSGYDPLISFSTAAFVEGERALTSDLGEELDGLSLSFYDAAELIGDGGLPDAVSAYQRDLEQVTLLVATLGRLTEICCLTLESLLVPSEVFILAGDE